MLQVFAVTQVPVAGLQVWFDAQLGTQTTFLQVGPSQMPSVQMPEQQFAWLEHSWPLQLAQVPWAQTPLQHCVPFWQLPPESVQAQLPELHTPLQHCFVAQLSA